MSLKYHLRKMKNWMAYYIFLLGNLNNKEKFECPVCGYVGPFKNINLPSGIRKFAKCPKCSALERHRLIFLVLDNVLNNVDTSSLKMLHFAPEPCFTEYFSKRFGQYETADLNRNDVDHNVDIQDIPFENQTYDLVFASHVLEHIPNDEKAISEIRRILKPNGIAILPVPLVSEKTVEYPEPNPNEIYHVRACGFDYFDRYGRHFPKIEKYGSDSFPMKHQLYIYEDRTQWPTEKCPLRPPMDGEKHIDIIPVCYACK